MRKALIVSLAALTVVFRALYLAQSEHTPAAPSEQPAGQTAAFSGEIITASPAASITSTVPNGGGSAAGSLVVPVASAESRPALPARLAIPAIGLNSPIEALGTNTKGEMAVPDGRTDRVGWYEYGTIPGQTGSAVIDAHVFAAFAKLKYLASGAGIDVTMDNGARSYFVVVETETYALADVPLDRLFNRNDGKYLNLITCAGRLTPDHSTYDHRLIVYAKLAGT